MSGKRFRLWTQLLVGGVLLLAIWVLLVWVSARPALRALIDLTPQQVNSVSPATEDLLRELRDRKAQIEFHLFYPPNTGQAADAAQAQVFRIRDRLRELVRLLLVRYQYLGGDSVSIKQHDFYADVQSTREAASRFDYRDTEEDVVGISVQMPGKEKRFRKLNLLLDLARIERPNTGAPGMARMSVPVLKSFVGEEQISSAIKSLLVEGTPIAYLLKDYSPLLSTTGAVSHGYSEFLASLGKLGFEVREWKTQAMPKVPDDASLVIVLEPTSEFTDRTSEALFDYVKHGGRVFLNFSWSPIPDQNPDGGRFAELMGYQLSQQPVFHKIRGGRNTAGQSVDGLAAVANLPMFINPLHPTTRRLADSGRPLEVAGARALFERKGAAPGIRREALLRTGDEGWLAVPGGDGAPSFYAPNIKLQSFDVGMALEVDVAPDAQKPNGPKTGQVVIVSGAFCMNVGMPMFGDFALNICNWLVERRVLLDLKAMGYEAKYLELKPPQLERIGYLLIWGVPLAFLAGLLFVVVWRRRQ